MENTTNSYYDDEREIDLIDILGRMISKWRSICLVSFLGLLIGCVVSCTIGYFHMKATNLESQRLSASKAVTLALNAINKEEKADELKEVAITNVDRYSNVQNLYDMQVEYNAKSIYNNLNASNVTKAKITYFIDNHYVNEYPIMNGYNNIVDIISAYTNLLKTDKVCNDIIKVTGLDTEPKYIRELISVSSDSTSSLSINIVLNDENTVRAIMNYYDNAMSSITEEIIANYGDVNFKLQSSQLYTESDMNILASQDASKNKVLEYYKQLENIRHSMTGVQKDYFEALVEKKGLDSYDKEMESYSFFFYVSKKLIALIAIAAAFVIVMIHGMIYLFDNTIKTGSELATLTRSSLIGTVLVDNDSKRKNILFDKWAIKLIDNRVMCDDPNRMLDTISTTVIKYLENYNLNNVLFVGTGIKHSELLDVLKEKIVKNGHTVNFALDAFDSSETVINLYESDLILFVGEVGKSKYIKLDRIMTMCHLYNKDIVGTITIQERI